MAEKGRETSRRRQGRRYERPALGKRERLAEVTEGRLVAVTNGGPPVKGGCFERARK